VSRLKVITYPPVNLLKDYIRRILVTLGDEQTDENIPIGPTGFAYFTYSRYPIILHYSKRVVRSYEQLYLTGQISDEQPWFEVRGKFFHVGVELLPSSLWYFFGVPGKDMVDTGMTLSQIKPALSDKLKKRVEKVKDPEEVARKLQQVLIDLLPLSHSHIPYIDKALEVIYSQSGIVEISELISDLNVSERHFRRQFKMVVGIGAKQYCKIIQFNTVFEAIKTRDEEKLTELALMNGYYDQSHFINDFKINLGLSPRNFLRSEHSFLRNYLGTFNQ